MWTEKRRQQHRAYWLKQAGGKDYEAFPTEWQARAFIALCKALGRDQIVAHHRARATGTAGPTATTASTSTTSQRQTITVPALAAGLTAPVPGGITGLAGRPVRDHRQPGE
jgi:hypothetical protein